MKIKRLSAVFLTLFFCFLMLCSCSDPGKSYALKVDGTEISTQIYNYYLAEASESPEYSETEDKAQLAAELCKRFKAGNELINKYGITLSAEEKVAASNKIRGIWQYYSSFYKSRSVSKQTLADMVEYGMLIDNLTASAVLTGTDYEEAQKKANAYFNKNYFAVSLIYSPFTDKKGNALKESEQKSLTDKFTEMRNLVRKGSTMSFAASRYPEIAKYDENKTDIICAGDKAYPEGMFNTVEKMENGVAQVYKSSDGIYLIRKLDITDTNQNYFERYKKECFLKLFGQNTEKAINTLAESYKIVYN